MSHLVKGFCIDKQHRKSGRSGQGLLTPETEDVCRRPCQVNRHAEGRGHGIDHREDPEPVKKRDEGVDVIQDPGRGITVDEGCVGKVVIGFKKGLELFRVNRLMVVCGIQDRDAAVESDKVRVSLSVDSVVEDEHPVPRLRKTCKGCLEAQDPLAGKDQGLMVLRVEEGLEIFADVLRIGIEIRVEVRVRAGKGEGLPHVFGNLCRSRGHEFEAWF